MKVNIKIKEVKDELIKYKINGDIDKVNCCLAEALCKIAIENGLKKTDFINRMKNSYDIVKEDYEKETH